MKRSDPEVGDIMIMKEDNLPPTKWRLCRIVAKHPGPDNLTRVVTVKTKNGEMRRPLIKLCPLPIQENIHD